MDSPDPLLMQHKLSDFGLLFKAVLAEDHKYK